MSLAITVCHVFSLAHVLRGASSCYKDKLFGFTFCTNDALTWIQCIPSRNGSDKKELGTKDK